MTDNQIAQAEVLRAHEALRQAGWWQLRNHDILALVSQRHPDKAAVRTRQESITFGELQCRIEAASKSIAALGATHGDHIAVCFPRCAEWIIAMFAIWRAGCVYVPIDSQMPSARIQTILDDCRPALVLSHESLSHRFGGIPTWDLKSPIGAAGTVSGMRSAMPLPATDAPAYVIYTSGTTGQPKGVQIEYDGIPAMALDMQLTGEIAFDDTALLFSSFSFDASLRDIQGTLFAGGTVYVPGTEEMTVAELPATLKRERITYLEITPSVLGSLDHEPLPCLRTVVVAGEASDRRLIRTWGAGRQLINAYGPTECTVCATKKLYLNGDIAEGESVSIGSATLGMVALVLRDDGSPAGVGEVGELFLSGTGISRRGYLNKPELTEQKFVPVGSAKHKHYRTGDSCRVLENGEFEWLGRLDNQVKVFGRRIELEEIRSRIVEVAGIRDACVFIDRAAELPRLVAFVLNEGPHGSDKTLELDVTRYLLQYLHPSHVPQAFHAVSAWPLTHAGKVDTAALRSMSNPLPHHEADPPIAEGESASAVAERVWRDVLCWPEYENIPLDTRFEQLGGGSMDGQIMLARLQKTLGLAIGYTAFLQSGSTLRGLLGLIQGQGGQAVSSRREPAPAVRTEGRQATVIEQPCPLDMPDGRPAVLVTGATGFLGVHLLAELLKLDRQVVCLVRPKRGVDARTRVLNALRHHALDVGDRLDRLQVVAGDVEERGLGLPSALHDRLASAVSAVYHCAADVDFLKPLGLLTQANVSGTRHVIDFIQAGQPKRLHLVSTLATFFSARNPEGRGEEIPTASLPGPFLGGYAESKWISEQMAHRHALGGADVTIFRPGRLLGSASNGICPESDLYVRFIKSMVTLGIAPDIDLSIDFTPVDVAAEQMVILAERLPDPKLDAPRIFHIIAERVAPLNAIVDQLRARGYAIEQVPHEAWRRRILDEDAIAIFGPLASVFVDGSLQRQSLFDSLLELRCYRTGVFETARTRAALAGSQARAFPGWETLLEQYVDAWISGGELGSPLGAGADFAGGACTPWIQGLQTPLRDAPCL